MRIAETLQQVVPSAKAITVVFTVGAGAFMAGVGAVLNWASTPTCPKM